MKDAQRVHHAADEGGPEDMLNQLIEFGYPWNALGSRMLETLMPAKNKTK
ncbi:MAG: hypothetical protein OXU54_01155 [Gammaproteobacteria bacterium]|nr:hypothetical protein [Gammaproteobacteria bacterium]